MFPVILEEIQRTSCQPREVCLEAAKEYPESTSQFFLPRCVALHRCGGCCNNEAFYCTNTSHALVNKTVSAGLALASDSRSGQSCDELVRIATRPSAAGRLLAANGHRAKSHAQLRNLANNDINLLRTSAGTLQNTPVLLLLSHSHTHTHTHTHSLTHLSVLLPADGTFPAQDGSRHRHGNLRQPHLVPMPLQAAAALHHTTSRDRSPVSEGGGGGVYTHF